MNILYLGNKLIYDGMLMDVHVVIRVNIEFESNVLEHMILDVNVEPINVSLALLQHITEYFAVTRVIGQGGFGVVYKVNLSWKIHIIKAFSLQT
jgi:hypothetical protein